MGIFVAVVEAGQLTRAAEDLGLSKSAVSHALKDLETYLDLQLLNRNARSWRLTDAGSIYYKKCKNILADVELMEDMTRGDRHNLSGLIRISAPDTFGSYTLTPVLSKFMDLHPNIVIELNLTERRVDLIEERVDLAFRTGHLEDSALIVQKIGEAHVSIFASPDYLKKRGEPKTHLDLKNHKCIQYTRSPTWRLKKEGKEYNFIPKSHVLTDSGETMREFCIRGQGLAAMPTMLAEFSVKKGRLVPVLKDYKNDPMPINAFRVKGNRASNRVLQLSDFVISELNSRKKDMAELVEY